MSEESYEQQMGLSREGVKKGTFFVPLILLIFIVVIFVAFVIKLPQPKLVLISKGGLPPRGNHEYVIAKVEKGDQEQLHFQIFDSKGTARINQTMEEGIVNAATEGAKRDEVKERLTTLKTNLKDLWNQEKIPLDVQSEIMNEVIGLTDYEPGLGEFSAIIFNSGTSVILHDFWILLRSQLRTIWVLLLCSLIPGLLGMIYRRAFWLWFLAAFLILFAINWTYSASGMGSIAAGLRSGLLHPEWTEKAFLFVEVVFILLILAYSLRRHSGEFSDPKTKRNDFITAAVLILLSGIWIAGMWFVRDWIDFSWFRFGCALILLVVGVRVLFQALATKIEKPHKFKNIVVCLDGTWNQPGQLDFGYLAETNVFKLFKMLKETKSSTRRYNASRYKQYIDEQTKTTKQIGFYYHGVGNSVENSQLGQLFGGAFGAGANAIVERAYLDVAKVYRPGDRIFIFGFSRGAAIARLFAGVIGRRGIPAAVWTIRLFGRHWTIYKSFEIEKDVPVEVLGCWDTVGAFGVSKDILGIPFQKINLLKDLTVSLCVKRAYHMVALDETRDSFVPTLMDTDPITPSRIIEVWLSGSHCNVGGGYATDKLSDLALDFLLKNISSGYAREDKKPEDNSTWTPGDESWGIYLTARKKGVAVSGDETITEIDPDPWGRIRESTGAMYEFAPREMPVHAVIHDSVFDRMKKALPVYAPESLFQLNEQLVKKREAIKKEVDHLAETGSHSPEECKEILEWSNQKLKLMKWTKYEDLEFKLDDPDQIKKLIAQGILTQQESQTPELELTLKKVIQPDKELSNAQRADFRGQG